MKNTEIFPKAYRYMIWFICIAVFSLIWLTGYIVLQMEGIDQEVTQMRQVMYGSLTLPR